MSVTIQRAHAARPEARRRVNVTVRSDLLKEARQQDLNLSRLLEEKLDETLRSERGRRWQEDNREAIAAYNARIARYGVFGDDKDRGF